MTPSPTPTPQFELFVDEECSEKPVAGEEYTDLYLRVNVPLSEGVNYNFNPSLNDCQKLYIDYTEGDPNGNIFVWVDLTAEFNNTIPAGSVVKVSSTAPILADPPIVTEWGSIN